MSRNRLEDISPDQLGSFSWQHASGLTVLPEGGIRITAPGKTDYFNDPAGKHVLANAPYLYLNVAGDFTAKVRVAHPFASTWDAAVLMIWADPDHWAKLCFEATDFGTRAIVSVVTRTLSDDANGVNYHWPEVWLQIARQGNLFAMHYGPDGEHWNMVRYFSLDLAEEIRVGLVGQCPSGMQAELDFLAFHLDNKAVNDMRAGI